MKRTKTIEVDVCDQCGDEFTGRHLKLCASCRKEMCGNCTAIMSVTVRVSTPHMVGTYRAYNVDHRNVDLNGTYCTACGNSIKAKLIEAGFVASPASHSLSGVTLD